MIEKQDNERGEDAHAGDEELLHEALALPREIEAPRAMWAGIEARIEAKRRQRVVFRRSVTGASMLLAAAVVILVVRTATHRGGEVRGPATVASTPSEPHRSLESVPPEIAPDEMAGLVVPEEASYLGVLATLTPTFDAQKDGLSEKERGAVGLSIEAIDAAIAVTRASLLEHPDDADLRAELDAEYEQKIDAMNDVLDWTTRS